MNDAIVYAKAAALVAAAFAVGIGTIGPAISQGLVGSKACENMAKYPENSSRIFNMALVSLALIETSALYVTGIAAALIFVAVYFLV
jgi:F-type H+-transporting ATPase subunit c